jgi:NarL family two-component system response regulator LiaR
MAESIKILIADDHAIVRTGLSALIEVEPDLELVGQASNGREAADKFHALKPDMVLMDLVMPVMGGIEAIQEIIAMDANARIMVLTSFAEDEQVIQAIKAGALGYILKDSSPDELVEGIREVSRGEPYLHSSFTRVLMKDVSSSGGEEDSDKEALSDRELDVLILLAQGLSNQDIADQLTVSVATVRFHVTNIFNKLQVENRTQAALHAIREGLVKI